MIWRHWRLPTSLRVNILRYLIVNKASLPLINKLERIHKNTKKSSTNKSNWLLLSIIAWTRLHLSATILFAVHHHIPIRVFNQRLLRDYYLHEASSIRLQHRKFQLAVYKATSQLWAQLERRLSNYTHLDSGIRCPLLVTLAQTVKTQHCWSSSLKLVYHFHMRKTVLMKETVPVSYHRLSSQTHCSIKAFKSKNHLKLH